MNELNTFNIDFADFGTESGAKPQTRIHKPKKFVAHKRMKYDNAQKLANEIEITEGSRYFVMLAGSFIAGDFIEALIVGKNYDVETLTVSTLSMSGENVDSLVNIVHAGFVRKLDLIVSDYFFSHERRGIVQYIYDELDKNDVLQMAVAGIHTKICLIKTACGKHIVIHGSANLRSSGNIEQIAIEEDKELYEFNRDFFAGIIDRYKTINKSIRHKKLWQADQE